MKIRYNFTEQSPIQLHGSPTVWIVTELPPVARYLASGQQWRTGYAMNVLSMPSMLLLQHSKDLETPSLLLSHSLHVRLYLIQHLKRSTLENWQPPEHCQCQWENEQKIGFLWCVPSFFFPFFFLSFSTLSFSLFDLISAGPWFKSSWIPSSRKAKSSEAHKSANSGKTETIPMMLY